MKIPTSQLKYHVRTYLQLSGMVKHDADLLTELVVEQEILGNQFSPVGELSGKHTRLVDNIHNVQEEVVTEKPSLMLLKGNGRLAPLITADNLDHVIKKAQSQGIYCLGIFDSSYNDFFDVFCRRVAAQDCIALIFENGGPQGVVPFGGTKDVTGTNPLAYGIPTHTHPIIFDAATAMHAYGRITQARETGEQLPDNAYVDSEGTITTDPHKAYAVLPFGGFKGYAINLLVDVLSGALVQARSGLDMPLESPDRHIGTLLIVIDPAAFGEIAAFKDATTKLVSDLLAVPPVDPKQPVKVPGIRGSERLAQAALTGDVELADHEWEKFEKSLRALEQQAA